MLKRILAVTMAIVMIISAIPMVGAARRNIYPVVMVSGFGATTLAIDGEAVFPPSMDKITDALGIEEFTTESLSLLISRFSEDTVAELSKLVKEIIEPVRMNADGTSYYDVEPIVSGAENTSLEAFTDNDMLAYVPYTGSEFVDMEMIGDEIGDNNVFSFMYDWRLDYDQTADQLKEYIDDVLELTGAERVNLYSISQGSLIVGQYLYKYAELGQTHNVVFDTPVLGGTSFATDCLSKRKLKLKLNYVLAIVSDVLHTELDLASLSGLLEGIEIIPEAIEYGRTDLILPAIYSCPAFHQMVPISDFPAIKKARLDPVKNAAVISMVERFQRGFMSNITETFERATEAGSVVSIKASTGFPLCTNTNEYSDLIVDMEYSCGAICAPYGRTFPADYVQEVDTGKNHISPDRTIDISAGYWPDRTWVLNGLTHGAPEWCPDSLALLMDLLLTDKIKDAYSHHEYPQFFESAAPTAKVKFNFENTNCSFLYAESVGDKSSVKVTNTSKQDTIILSGLSSSTGAVSFDYGSIEFLAPGQSAYVPVTAEALKNDVVTLTYMNSEKPAEPITKDFAICVTDDYSGEVKTEVKTETTVGDLLDNFEIKSFIFNMLIRVLKSLFARAGIEINLGNLGDLIGIIR